MINLFQAAHCTIRRNLLDTTVLVGTNTLNAGGTIHRVDQIINHPHYGERATLANDVSVVRVMEPFVWSNRVGRIMLSSSYTGENAISVFTGWGFTSFPNDLPNHLQIIKLRTINNEECRSRHETTGGSSNVFDHKICTLNQIDQGGCVDDSGGPLVYNNQQIGIFSWL